MNRNNILLARKEEIGNAVTHGIGAGLAIAGLVALIILASYKGTAWHIIGFSVFGSMMVILYFTSTLYHSFRNKKLKTLFRKFDHMAIYLLIAGTYTPFCLTVLEGPWRWVILSIVWTSAVLGIVLKGFFTGKKVILSTVLYVLMGWLIIVVIKPLYLLMPLEGFIFLLAGGLFYTTGTFFYAKEKIRYNHMIWHLFVLFGTTFHFFSVMTLLK